MGELCTYLPGMCRLIYVITFISVIPVDECWEPLGTNLVLFPPWNLCSPHCCAHRGQRWAGRGGAVGQLSSATPNFVSKHPGRRTACVCSLHYGHTLSGCYSKLNWKASQGQRKGGKEACRSQGVAPVSSAAGLRDKDHRVNWAGARGIACNNNTPY